MWLKAFALGVWIGVISMMVAFIYSDYMDLPYWKALLLGVVLGVIGMVGFT